VGSGGLKQVGAKYRHVCCQGHPPQLQAGPCDALVRIHAKGCAKIGERVHGALETRDFRVLACPLHPGICGVVEHVECGTWRHVAQRGGPDVLGHGKIAGEIATGRGGAVEQGLISGNLVVGDRPLPPRLVGFPVAHEDGMKNDGQVLPAIDDLVYVEMRGAQHMGGRAHACARAYPGVGMDRGARKAGLGVVVQ